MKQIVLSLFTMLAFAGIHAQDLHNAGNVNKDITPFHDAVDAANGLNTAYLKKQIGWQQFIQQYPSWGAKFNQYTKLPHRAFGTPISFAPGGNDPVAKAIAFLQQSFAGFDLPLNELVLTRNFNDGKYINVDFKQLHDNKEILWSRVSVRFTQDLRITLIGLDAHRNIPALTATLTPADAIQKAIQAITTTVTNTSVAADMKILPLPVDGANEYRLVYVVHVETINDNKTPGNYLNYVDANTGDILYRQNEVHFFDAKIKGDVHPVNQYTATENRPMKNLKVKVGATTYYTDNSGIATIPSAATATISLEGKWVKVLNSAASATTSASFNHAFVSSGDSTTFDVTVANSNVRGVNVYYHVNEIHDFMKTKFPTFTVMDNPLPANVDVAGTCNAFYNGTSINFYAAGGGCNAFSYIGDVMTHEYGHGINDKFYTWQGASFDNGGMGEGYADTWANCILKTGIVGLGASSPTDYIRRYDINPKVYPQDLVGQVHADGEIIAGAWWDVAQNWNSIDSMGDLFAASYYGLANGPDGTEGAVYQDILIDALTYDDDNSNITDGTPHFNYIVSAFAAHGIYLLTNTKLEHVASATIPASAPFTITADAVADFPAFLGDVKMIYRKKGTIPSDTIVMTKSLTNYTCQFPSAMAGDVYEYMFAVYDYSNILSAYSPLNSNFNTGFTSRNIPYYLLVGYNSYVSEPFDTITNSSIGWTIGNFSNDNATAGKWIVAVPISSVTNGDTVQTGKDHTTGTGKCAVTGNGASAASAANTADVDGGRTSLITPSYDLSGYTQPVISYWRWFSNSQGPTNIGKDLWRVWISYDNGTTWSMAEKTYKPDVRWRRSVVIPDLTKGTSFKLMFIATDTVYTNVAGTWVEAAVDDIEILALGNNSVGVNDISSLQSTLYPNPASDEITITTPENGSMNYSILNAVGQRVLYNENALVVNNSMKINTTTLANGIYFIKLDMKDKKSIHRLVIAK